MLNNTLAALIFMAVTLFTVSFVTALGNSAINILIVTGGKNFDEAEFYKIFDENENISYDTASKPTVFEIFNSDVIDNYDAVLFYDAYRTTTGFQKEAFLNLFKKGISCLFLHHSLVSHQDWDEYKTIIGGKYHYNEWEEEGKKYGASTYKHDQDFTVTILDENHPVLENLSAFSIRDETYINVEIIDKIYPLIASDDCESMKFLGWINKYLNSDIVYIQLGHDRKAYRNENFRKLIYNSLFWLGK